MQRRRRAPAAVGQPSPPMPQTPPPLPHPPPRPIPPWAREECRRPPGAGAAQPHCAEQTASRRVAGPGRGDRRRKSTRRQPREEDRPRLEGDCRASGRWRKGAARRRVEGEGEGEGGRGGLEVGTVALSTLVHCTANRSAARLRAASTGVSLTGVQQAPHARSDLRNKVRSEMRGRPSSCLLLRLRLLADVRSSF